LGNWVKTGQPCPCGKSSDAYAEDDKGSGFCFSGNCSSPYFRGGKQEEIDDSKYSFEFYEHRGILKRTFEKYGVKTKFFEDTPIETAFFYPNGSIKIRNMAEKRFRTQGDMKNVHLFGKNVYDKGSKSTITLTEGEYDALSISQVIGDSGAVVSVRSSVTAKGDCIAEHDYINSFDKIIINFDNDSAGQDAAKKVASLFDFKKTYNLCLTAGKDANSYVANDLSKELYEAWKGVKRYTPDSILSTMAEFKNALKTTKEEKLVNYPFSVLQDKLKGIHSGEIVLVKGLEGLGKTELLRAIENKVLSETNYNVGIIHLEESNSTTLRAMAGYYVKEPLQDPEMPASDEEITTILEKIIGPNEDRFVLYSAFDVEDEDKFIGNIRFMVTANNCRIVTFDHISWMAVDSEGKEEDERRKLDRITQKLKKLAEELRFALIMVSHVNDNGQTRGSRYISKAANTVIHLSRDKTSSDDTERTKLHLMVEKARLAGSKEGPAGYALYDMEKLMLIDPVEKGLEMV